ncbi:MAG: hypothetical protein EZS28_028192, partial [Streblomastix strix]
MPPKLLK